MCETSVCNEHRRQCHPKFDCFHCILSVKICLSAPRASRLHNSLCEVTNYSSETEICIVILRSCFDDAKANGVYRRISVYEKTHRYWAIAKSRASQINYIEGVYHGIVRSVLKVEGHGWAFCDDESNVSLGKERCCFRGVLTMDSSYLNKDVSDYPFGSGGAIRYI